MGNPLTRCVICGDYHTGTASACDECSQYERATDAWLAREQRRFKRLPAHERAAALAVRGELTAAGRTRTFKSLAAAKAAMVHSIGMSGR